jgi:sec-independent protein translocase protein TatB
MFDLDPGKLIVIGIVALVAIPSKDLPRVLRTLGQATGRMRRMAAEFQDQFMDALREAELDEVRREYDNAKAMLKEPLATDGRFDAAAEARRQMAIEADRQKPVGPVPDPAAADGAPEVSPRDATSAPQRDADA